MPAPPPNKNRLSPYALGAYNATNFAQKAILWWLPFLYLLISDSFYLRTYDSAQVKITLVQMGGICLFGLWVSRLLDEGRSAFSKTDAVCLAPFLAYFAYGIFSYLHAPYKFSSLDFFLRRIFYMSVALIVIREFHEQSINRFTRILIWTTWLTVGYGFLQWFDVSFFPPGAGNGPDPFIWRGAFGSRVFSTFGNPNFFADFLVIILPVLVCQFLKNREFKYLPLTALTLFDLGATQTKGAWIGAAISFSLLAFSYFWFFNFEALRRIWKWLVAGCAALLLGVFVTIGAWMMSHSWTSVNFRLFTWEATWEMIMTQPIIGTGIGSFWTVYPAFRRPPIFHIEGKHNTETDHSEDEYLEVLFDEGILGLGIFLWMLLSTFVVAYRSLGQLTGDLKKGQRAPPRAYDLLGYLIALQGMMAHNFFDVSLRFVSSGVYIGLLSGLVVSLSRGISLAELHSGREAPDAEAPAGPSAWETASSFLIWPLRAACWGALAYMAYVIFTDFNELQGPLFRMSLSGEILQWWVSWTAFLFCLVCQLVIFGNVVLKTRNALVPIVIATILWPLNLSWGFFKADVHHNIAIFFSKQQNWEQAVKNYLEVGKLNPAFVMSYYFKGNVFNDRFNMTKVYNQNWGDLKDQPRDDFERALAAYGEVRAQAPNYVQMHHQMGVLHLKRAEWELNQGRKDQAEHYMDEALKYFQMYRNIDPVFPPNYYRMAQVYMMRKQYDKAAEIYSALIEANECMVEPAMLQKYWMRRTILNYQPYTEVDGVWKHIHETSDAYTQLGNAYFLGDRLPESAKAYQNALRLDPQNANAGRNLQVTYGKAQSLGRLKLLPPPPGPPGAPKAPPIPEILPPKK